MARANPTQRKLEILCPPECSLHPDKIGEDKAHLLMLVRASGVGLPTWQKRGAEILGRPISNGTAGRHSKHYRDPEDEARKAVDDPERKASDVEILDSVIQAAWRNRANWKPTLRDMLEAMAKKHSITGGSEASDLMSLFDAPLDDEEIVEAPEAVLSPEERPEDSDADLVE